MSNVGNIHDISRRQLMQAAMGGVVLGSAGALFGVPGLAFGDKLDDQIAAKNAEADQLASQIADARLEIEQIVDKIHTAEEERDAAEGEVTEAKQNISDTQEQIEENTARIGKLQEDVKEQMRSRYRSDDMGLYDVVMGSASFEEFINRWNMLQRVNDASTNTLTQVKSLREENERKKHRLELLKEVAEGKAAEAQARADEQVKLRQEAETKVARLETMQAQVSAEIEQLAEKKQQIALEIAKAQAAAGDKVQIIGNPHELEPCPEVVPYAVSKLGVPYVYCTHGPDTFDCSGLTHWVYKQIGIKLPTGPSGQYKQALREGAVLPIALSEPGDVLYRPGHVGLVTQAGGAQFIHAPGVGKYVEYGKSVQKSGFLCVLRYPRP